MTKKDFELTCMFLNVGIIVLLLTLAIVILTNDWFLILVEICWIGGHIMLISLLEYLVLVVNKK